MSTRTDLTVWVDERGVTHCGIRPMHKDRDRRDAAKAMREFWQEREAGKVSRPTARDIEQMPVSEMLARNLSLDVLVFREKVLR